MNNRDYFSLDEKEIDCKQAEKIDAFIADVLKICEKHGMFITELDETSNEVVIDNFDEIHKSWFQKVHAWPNNEGN